MLLCVCTYYMLAHIHKSTHAHMTLATLRYIFVSVVSKTTEPAAKKREKTKKETQRKCEDEEDLFPAPRDDDDVQGDTYSPFSGRSGLFSGGQGLFDNEWEGDLFAEALKEEPRAVKTVAAPEPAVTKSGKKVPVGAVSLYPGVDLFGGSVVAEPSRRKEVQKERRTAEAVKPAIASGLFDDDDEDDLFGSGLKPKSAPPKPRTAAVLFEDSEDSGLFEPAVTPKLGKDKPKRKAKNVDEQPRAPDDSPPLAEKSQTSSGLFSDEDESQDLFSTNSDTKGNQPTVQAPAPVSHNPVSLFDDEDEGGWHGSEQRKPTDKLAPSSQVGKPSPDRQTTEKPGPVSPAHKKLSLFDNDSESDNDADLFGVSRRESQKKSHKVSLLFEDEDDLFGPARSAGKSMSPPTGTVFTWQHVTGMCLQHDVLRVSRSSTRSLLLHSRCPSLTRSLALSPSCVLSLSSPYPPLLSDPSPQVGCKPFIVQYLGIPSRRKRHEINVNSCGWWW
uniref:FAM21/CAPZIP domain-containing protein n=1 Tax=Callorhinchus milii TaxID=7868 RepID=A0A4W3HVT2_CALMI